MTTLVYVHGTNGSGKSTLARAVLAAAGGICEQYSLNDNKRAKWLTTKSGVVLLGKYTNRPCGGVDCVAPYSDVLRSLHVVTSGNGFSGVFAEGLMTPGLQTCTAYSDLFDHAVFIHLATPPEQCLVNHLKRKATIGSTRTYDPKNLYRKHQSASNWADRLERAGLNVQRLQYRQAYNTTLELLGLPEPSVDDLL